MLWSCILSKTNGTKQEGYNNNRCGCEWMTLMCVCVYVLGRGHTVYNVQLHMHTLLYCLKVLESVTWTPSLGWSVLSSWPPSSEPIWSSGCLRSARTLSCSCCSSSSAWRRGEWKCHFRPGSPWQLHSLSPHWPKGLTFQSGFDIMQTMVVWVFHLLWV